MHDPQVEDISCDGVNVPIYIYHRNYGSIRSNLKFTNDRDIDFFVVWLAQKCGKSISIASPMLDATVPDGSRLQATLGKHVTKKGSSFTVRRFKENPYTPIDLIKFKTMSIDMMAYLWIAIEHGESMLVCGGTASGKTTTLNGILLFIPPQMKIVTIEDTRELNLPHENWVPTLTRSGFGAKNMVTGKTAGEIDMFDLLVAALRQRPQYLMVGEVRGPEAYVVFQAMATGKTAYTTFHAESVQAMVHRMENDPINLPRALITALNIVLMQAQVKVGMKMTRRVKGLTEIVGLDPETNELITNTAYTWNPADDTFNYSGHSYVYERYAAGKNWTQKEMQAEVKRRVDILEYMRKVQVVNHRDVAKIISTYYKNPKTVMDEVRKVLYEGAQPELFASLKTLAKPVVPKAPPPGAMPPPPPPQQYPPQPMPGAPPPQPQYR
jgi:flagellar protein FlaI